MQRKVKLCLDNYSFKADTGVCVPDDGLMKPASTPCEIVYKDGSFQSDSRNPNCETFKNQYDVSGAVVRLKGGDGDVEFVRNTDGTYTIRRLGDDGKWYTVQTGGFANSGANEGGAAISSNTKSDTGGFVGAIGNSSGGGGCGGESNPCKIDDSAFSGKDADIASKVGEIEGKEQGLLDGLGNYQGDKGNDKFGFDGWDWRLWPAEAIECQNLVLKAGLSHGPLSGLDGEAPIPICDKLSGIKDFMSWLVYIAGSIYIWRRIIRANSSGDR
jgi:hypothetical protein